MTVAPVCHVGDPLQMTCTAPAQSLRWSIFQVNEQGLLTEVTGSVLIDSHDANQRKQNEVDSTTFTFIRISAPGASPTSSIDSVSIGLNGIVVRCSDAANPMTSASTTIQLFDTTTIGESAKIIIIIILLSVF